MKKIKACIGYNKDGDLFPCGKPVAENSVYWCADCEEVRRKRISKNLEDLVLGFSCREDEI